MDIFFCSENHRNINGWIFQQATYSKAEKTEKIAQEMITILVVALLFYIWGCHMDKTNHFTLIDIEIIYDNKFFFKTYFFIGMYVYNQNYGIWATSEEQPQS